jgi:hypothetical protein
VIPGLQPGRYRLEARRDGFMPQQQTVEVQDGADVEGVTFTLEPLLGFWARWWLAPATTRFFRSPAGKTSLSREQIDQIPHFRQRRSVPCAGCRHDRRGPHRK